MDTTIQTYSTQFSSLCDLIQENNKELITLRQQGSESETQFFKISVQNEILDAKVQGLNFEHEMRLA
jgi:hypothetical protein